MNTVTIDAYETVLFCAVVSRVLAFELRLGHLVDTAPAFVICMPDDQPINQIRSGWLGTEPVLSVVTDSGAVVVYSTSGGCNPDSYRAPMFFTWFVFSIGSLTPL